jgi:hypothetical protein
MERQYPNKWCLTVLSVIRGEGGLIHGCRIKRGNGETYSNGGADYLSKLNL